jgi:hypothetical protein
MHPAQKTSQLLEEGHVNTLAKALASGALVLAAGVSAAQADVLAVGGYANSTPLTPIEKAVQLRANGAKELPFATKANNTFVVITYNAGCHVSGDGGGYVSIRIAVDGIETHPRAGANFAFCTAVDPNTSTGTRVSRQAVIKVPRAGKHRVEVFGSTQLAGQSALRNSSIVVQD